VSLAAHHREDLIRAARAVLSRQPALATHLSINSDAGTVSDRRDGEVWAYVATDWTAMSPEQVIGLHPWPVQIHV